AGRTCVVNGGSFISYELAEAMRERGLHVAWVIRGTHFLRRVLHAEGGRLVDQIARRHGVDMIYGHEIAEVKSRHGLAASVTLSDGRELPCDVLAVGIGLHLNTEIVQDAGVRCHKGIVVDSQMQTNVLGIFAGGDVAEFFDIWTGTHHRMGTWNNAIGHGRTAALAMLGKETTYGEIPEYTTGMFHRKMMAFGITPENEPTVESEYWVDFENEEFRQLFFMENRLVGGVLIGSDLSRKFYKDIIKSREGIPESDRRRLLQPPKTTKAIVSSN
ncbi:MAG: NAD(P)/FAD-dependent oxidoreductase, partial [Cyanobacteria bacterium REEB65]|nr:NAD(P)/FAD-dependent oxidoreductase [Cyanobacteria bacterium REEB65]